MTTFRSATGMSLLIVLLCSLTACGGGGGGGGSNGGGGGGGGGGGATNQPPSFSSATDFTFAENDLVSFTLVVTDPDSPTVTIRSLAGGDGALFILDTASGTITANTPNGGFDFENPEDADADNVYEQQVELSDGTNTVTDTITVTITNVDEGPEFPQLPEFQLNENQTGVIVTFNAVDPEGGTVSDYQVAEVSKLGEVVNADRLVNAFSLDSVTGELSVVIPFDAEVEGTQDTIDVAVSATDGAILGFGGVSIRIVDLPSRLGNGVRISGADTVNSFGDTAAPVGDIDGDGVDEVFIAGATDETGLETGYLLWGAPLRDALAAGNSDEQISDLMAAERVVFTGDDRSQTVRRSRLTGVDVGDVDNDGRDDLLVLMREGREGTVLEEEDNGPLAYLVWGSTLERGTTDSVALTALSAVEGVAIGGLFRQAAVGLVAAGADFDSDDRADLVLGMPDRNRSYVIFGDALEAAGGTLNLSTATNSQAVQVQSELTGLAIIQQTGRRVAAMADITADGVPELVVSGEGLEPNFQSGAFVTSGALIAAAKGSNDIVNLSSDTNDTAVVEATVVDIAPDSLATDGDADGDGLADLAIGHTGNFQITRVASVVYGATLAATFGTTDEIDLNFASGVEGVAISDDGSSASQTIDVDPVQVEWIGNADAAAGDELIVAVPNASPLGRNEAGYLLVFTQANLAAGVGDLRIDSTSMDSALGRVLQGYGTGIRTGRELFAIDLDGDAVLEIGTASALAGSEAAGIDTGGVVIFAGSIVGDAIAAPEGASDLATTVVVEAP